MQDHLIVAPSPFLRNKSISTRKIMLDVIIAMLPTALAAVWFFGLAALKLIIVGVVSAVLAEGVYNLIAKQDCSVGDLSAVVTGMLVAFNIPANAPWWMAAVGSVLAIVLVKMMFGGLGQNFVNPALAARTFLMLSWTGLIAATAAPAAGQLFGLANGAVDAVAGATPLVDKSYSLWNLFIGNVPGMLGETCKLTILLGGLYLVLRGVIDWRTPVCFIVVSFILFWVKLGTLQDALYQILSGGLFLGAVFMATDYVTSPITKWGKVIMGVGCAVILFVIRTFNTSYPEGCSFAILFMNLLTPFIDKLTAPTAFGAAKKGGAK